MNVKTVVGYATTFSILGFTAYAIYRYVKRKETDQLIITAEEAKSEIEIYRNSKMDQHQEEFDDMVHEIRDTAGWNRSFMPNHPNRPKSPSNDEELEDELEEDLDEVIDDIDASEEPLENTEEEGSRLKHDPDSQEARQQFINMELAGFGIDLTQTLLKLFNFPFVPANDGDYDLKTKLIDYRVMFFGFNSQWVQDISFAEVILYYARSATYNYDESVEHWVNYFLQFNTLNHRMSSNSLDDVIESLNNHTYYNNTLGTHGLFGLNDDSINKAAQIASRNMDDSLTYDIEFNELLKTLS